MNHNAHHPKCIQSVNLHYCKTRPGRWRTRTLCALRELTEPWLNGSVGSRLRTGYPLQSWGAGWIWRVLRFDAWQTTETVWACGEKWGGFLDQVSVEKLSWRVRTPKELGKRYWERTSKWEAFRHHGLRTMIGGGLLQTDPFVNKTRACIKASTGLSVSE